jgi:hypothetical protein
MVAVFCLIQQKVFPLFFYSAKSMRQAIKWDQHVTSAGLASTVEHKKISDIKFLNPFKTKVTVVLLHCLSPSWLQQLITYCSHLFYRKQSSWLW